jgi:hypothetical protein
MDPKKSIVFTEKERTPEELAVKHYATCKPCRDQGLATFMSVQLTCQDTIDIWAKEARAMWLGGSYSLIEEQAVEHVWGKYNLKNFMGGEGYENTTGCKEEPCRSLRSYWNSITIGGEVNGASGVINLFSELFRIYKKAGWPFDRLFTIQEKRVSKVLDSIKSGKIKVSSGHYDTIDQLVQEVKVHVAVIQFLLEPLE